MVRKRTRRSRGSTDHPTPSTTRHEGTINDIDLDALQEVVEAITADPAKGQAEFHAKTTWQGGLKSESHVDSWHLGGERLPQDYAITIDEPCELLGEGTAANPQMFLQAALNACMLNTYVAAASVMGIELEHLEFESSGELDLRGFLGIDESIPAGYEAINVTIHVRGNGTREQYEKCWELVQRQSPNYFNTTERVPLKAEIVVD